MLSLEAIVNEVYDRLSVDTDSTTYWKTSRVIPKINSVMHRILSDRKFDVLIQDSTYHPYIQGGDLQFLRGTYSFKRRPSKVVCKKSIEWDDRVYIGNSTNVPAKGWCLIKGTVYKFTLNTDGDSYRLKLDEELTIEIEQGSEIEFLYKIPDNAEATYQLFALANNREVEMLYADYRYPTDFQRYWTILYKNGVSLIRIVAYDAWYLETFKLNYFNKVANLVNMNDVSVFPEERRDRDVLALLVAGELLFETERTDDATVKLNEGYWNLVLFYDKFATTNKWFRQDMWWNRRLQNNTVII